MPAVQDQAVLNELRRLAGMVEALAADQQWARWSLQIATALDYDDGAVSASKHHSADRMLSTAIFFRTSGSASPAVNLADAGKRLKLAITAPVRWCVFGIHASRAISRALRTDGT